MIFSDTLTNISTNDLRIYNVPIAKELSIYASVLLSELYNHYQISRDRDLLMRLPGSDLDWFFYDTETAYNRLGITRSEQRTSLKLLSDHDLILKRVAGMPGKRCFALNFHQIREFQRGIKEFQEINQISTHYDDDHIRDKESVYHSSKQKLVYDANISNTNFDYDDNLEENACNPNSNDIENIANQNSNDIENTDNQNFNDANDVKINICGKLTSNNIYGEQYGEHYVENDVFLQKQTIRSKNFQEVSKVENRDSKHNFKNTPYILLSNTKDKEEKENTKRKEESKNEKTQESKNFVDSPPPPPSAPGASPLPPPSAARPKASPFSSKSILHAHGNHVKLKNEDYAKLCKDNTKELIDTLIIEMNDYCDSIRPNGYKCYSAALRVWARRYRENGAANYFKDKFNRKPNIAKHSQGAIKQNESPEERKSLGGKRINKAMYNFLMFQGRNMEGYIIDEKL